MFFLRAPLAVASVLVLASLAAACAPGSDDVGVSAHALDTGDLATAREVVALLGGDSGHCSQCHGITASQVRAWGNAMLAVDEACLATGNDDPNAPATDLTPRQKVDCLRSNPKDPSSAFAARRLGFYAAGAAGDDFKQLFAGAFPGSTTEYSGFVTKVGMPRAGAPLTAAEFAKVKDWVLAGMKELDHAFGGTPAPPCVASSTPELAAHVAAMKSGGWGARLSDQSTPMFGCSAGGAALDCLGTLTDVTTTFGAGNVTQKLRRLHQQPLRSHYWVRSSADGRYVGYGMDDSAAIVDLSKPETSPAIAVAANYDPYFLPSNDGFAFAGSQQGDAIVLCRQSLLADVASAASPSISLTESKCSKVGDDVYMSIGTALDGSRYFMTFGDHENDDGGNDVTSPLPAAFSAAASTIFTPMVNDGLGYRAQTPIAVSLPFEGDMMLSPSSLLSATRFGDGDKPLGYRIRLVQPKPTDGGGLALDTPLGAEICMPGQKATFSYDERFLVTHQYVDPSDPSNVRAGLPEESSNIMIADLTTGKQVRLTASKHGVYALYPHFRADGWLYFAVRDMNQNVEYLVASDAALRMAQ